VGNKICLAGGLGLKVWEKEVTQKGVRVIFLRLVHRTDSKATRALPEGEERSGSEGARLRRRSDSDGGKESHSIPLILC